MLGSGSWRFSRPFHFAHNRLDGRWYRTWHFASSWGLGRFLQSKSQHAQQGHAEAGEFIRRQMQVASAMQGDLVTQLHLLGIEKLRQFE